MLPYFVGGISMFVENLMLEITRFCNFSCEHCCRGASQNIIMSDETVQNVFRGIKRVRRLLLTGGEPLIAQDTLKLLLKMMQEGIFEADIIDIITNGTIMNSQVLWILKEMQKVTNLQLKVSGDIFHKLECLRFGKWEERNENLKCFQELFNAEEYGRDDTCDFYSISLYKIGRACNITLERLNEISMLINKKYIIDSINNPIHLETFVEGDILFGALYVDVNGNLIRMNILDYEKEDEELNRCRININEMDIKSAILLFLDYLEDINRNMMSRIFG